MEKFDSRGASGDSREPDWRQYMLESSKLMYNVAHTLTQNQRELSQSQREMTHSQRDMQMQFRDMQKQFGDAFLVVAQQIKDTRQDVQETKEDVKETRKEVKETRKEVKENKKSIEEVKVQIQKGMNSRFANPPPERAIFSLLPLLFNGVTGHCAWVPVNLLERDDAGQVVKDGDGKDVVKAKLVVVSLIMVKFFVSKSYNAHEYESVCKQAVQAKLEKYFSHRPSDEDFFSIMLQTPFKPYSRGKSEKSYSFGNNEREYVIVGAEWFKAFLAEIKEKWPDQPQTFDFESCGRPPANAMTHYYSLEDPFEYTNMRSRRVTRAELKRIPAFGFPWWFELYEGAVADFFDIPFGEDGKVEWHVCCGVYEPSRERVMSFLEVRSSSRLYLGMEDDTHKFADDYDDDEDDEDDDDAPPAPKGKGKGKRRQKQGEGPKKPRRSQRKGS